MPSTHSLIEASAHQSPDREVLKHPQLPTLLMEHRLITVLAVWGMQKLTILWDNFQHSSMLYFIIGNLCTRTSSVLVKDSTRLSYMWRMRGQLWWYTNIIRSASWCLAFITLTSHSFLASASSLDLNYLRWWWNCLRLINLDDLLEHTPNLPLSLNALSWMSAESKTTTEDHSGHQLFPNDS